MRLMWTERLTSVRFKAVYNDGRTAVSHAAECHMEGEWLWIVERSGSHLARWALADIRLSETNSNSPKPRLRCGFSQDDRLTLEDRQPLGELERHCPNLKKTQPGFLGLDRPILLWAGAAVVSVFLLFTVGIPALAEQVARIIPSSYEESIGTSSIKQMGLLFGKTCSHADGERALNEVFVRLAPDLAGRHSPKITVINHDMINAFALPGGQIAVFRGLIDFTDSPNELVGILAHELGHHVNRHPMSLLTEEAGVSTLAGMLFGDVAGGALIVGAGRMMVSAAYTRDKERIADDYAIDLMNKAGFDVRPLGAFLDRVSEKHHHLDEKLGLLSTHPVSQERNRDIAEKATGSAAAMSLTDWNAVKSMCGPSKKSSPIAGGAVSN